jgi:hypothetical protein
LSATLNKAPIGNTEKQIPSLIVIKTKNINVRKAAVLDVLTNRPFATYVPENLSTESLTLEKEYLAQLKGYISKNLEGIDEEFINFLMH